MPIEPEPTPWVFASPDDPRLDDLVALGADLAPGTLLSAYRAGIFPMPGGDVVAELGDQLGQPGEPLQWFSPVERGILPLGPDAGMRVTRSLRKSAKRFEIRVDTAFEQVMAGCADPARDGAWIDAQITQAYVELHRMGWAHSVETWLVDESRDSIAGENASGRLVGGLYGLSIGGLFAGESMFHTERDASKVALMGLVDILTADGITSRLLDVQWQTEHLETLGVIEVPRPEYLRRLGLALELPAPSWPSLAR